MSRKESQKVLVLGSGGREHAIVEAMSITPGVELFCAPGNAGTAEFNLDLDPEVIAAVVDHCVHSDITQVIVGTETALAAGVTNELEAKGIGVFGPTQAAAKIESSKAWASEFMEKFAIPQPESQVFDSFAELQDYLQKTPPEKIVIKVDGLAAGKGVFLPETKEAGIDFARKAMLESQFGEAAEKIVIQERLSGREFSILVFADGTHYVMTPPLQDYKRDKDGDQGLNTGGMGVVGPVSFVTSQRLRQVEKLILRPTIAGLQKQGTPFKGMLYLGLMLTDTGEVKVIEYNCRPGDPEMQVLLTLLSSELAPIISACINETLVDELVKFADDFAALVVLASGGYPQEYEIGKEIHGLDKVSDEGVVIYHAGTKKDEDGVIRSSGGRVLNVMGKGKTLSQALKKTYSVIGQDGLHFEKMNYRGDIGVNAL